jgi:hypothetical protein
VCNTAEEFCRLAQGLAHGDIKPEEAFPERDERQGEPFGFGEALRIMKEGGSVSRQTSPGLQYFIRKDVIWQASEKSCWPWTANLFLDSNWELVPEADSVTGWIHCRLWMNFLDARERKDFALSSAIQRVAKDAGMVRIEENGWTV